VDVRLCADGELVLAHDADLGRLFGRPDLVVERLGTAEIAGFVPRLADAVAALPPGFPLNLDLKRDEAPRSAITRAVLELAERTPALLSSFDWRLLEAIRAEHASVPLALLAHDGREASGLAAATPRLRPWSWHVESGLATNDLLAAAPVPVLVYTINGAARGRELFAAGAAGVFTDDPATLRAARWAVRGSGPARVR
jgi:glycerophosphoryl diester phosphodiesterase